MPFPSDPFYRRVDVERQGREPGGGWSAWAPVDIARNYQFLDNLPEVAGEELPEAVRPVQLVDPLPLLKKGTYRGINPEALLRAPREPAPPAAGPEPGEPGRARSRTEPPVVMIRYLDFTAEPGRSYRYRVRVVKNDRDRRDRKLDEAGPWSGATGEVAVP